jgi:hypothetical protein
MMYGKASDGSYAYDSRWAFISTGFNVEEFGSKGSEWHEPLFLGHYLYVVNCSSCCYIQLSYVCVHVGIINESVFILFPPPSLSL